MLIIKQIILNWTVFCMRVTQRLKTSKIQKDIYTGNVSLSTDGLFQQTVQIVVRSSHNLTLFVYVCIISLNLPLIFRQH